MITIPQTELYRVLRDVIPFAPDDKGDPRNGVLIQWLGEPGTLTASATDVLSGGCSLWVPGTGVENEVTDDEGSVGLGVDWGSDGYDSRYSWQIFISLPDAKEIVKVFKPTKATRLAPVELTINVTQTRLIIERTGTPEWSGAALALDTPDAEVGQRFPDVLALSQEAGTQAAGWFGYLHSAKAQDDNRATVPPQFAPYQLARVGTVYGYPATLLYAGPESATAVVVGSTFRGFLYPTSDEAQKRARLIAEGRDPAREAQDPPQDAQ